MKTSNKTSRLFIGLALPIAEKDSLKCRIEKIKQELSSNQIHWVLPENYHLTLEFLGMVEEEKTNSIIQSLREVQDNFISFNIELGEWLFFPNSSQPKVIAIYVHLDEMLGKLRAAVHQKMLELDFILEQRPYLPHITVARCKNVRLPAIRNISITPHPIFITQLTLFESIQIDNQRKYIIKANFSF